MTCNLRHPKGLRHPVVETDVGCSIFSGICRVILLESHIIWLLIMLLQGGEDAEDALSCRSLSAKERLIIGFFCGNWPVKIRHPMSLGHPVATHTHHTRILRANEPLITGLFCGKRPVKIRHPMCLGHPVATHTHHTRIMRANDCLSHYSFLHHLGLYVSSYAYNVHITFPVHSIHYSFIALHKYVWYYAYNVHFTFPLH